MYMARYAFLAIFILVGGCIFAATVVAIMAFQVSDHIAIYTISENVLNFSIIVLIPFTLMSAMTMCTYNNLHYQIYSEDIEFPVDNAHNVFNLLSKNKKVDVKKENVDQLTTQLLESLLHDPAASKKTPVPELNKAGIKIINF